MSRLAIPDTAVDSPYRVPGDGSFRVGGSPTAPPPEPPGKKQLRKERKALTRQLGDLQRRLFAEQRRSLLVVFQAMDAAGKDSTIRAVMSGVNPAGCSVHGFRAPTRQELDHDFLWRTSRVLPRRGTIGIFNRSYYEEVLVVRVHPSFLQGQRIDLPDDLDALWPQRLTSIAEHEAHLARQGTVIVKFWLNVSRETQRQRLLARIDNPDKHWKFNEGDLDERQHWDAYMAAYEDALQATSRPWAPWYAIPADDKPFMRRAVADILVRTLQRMDPRYPVVADDVQARLQALRGRIDEVGE